MAAEGGLYEVHGGQVTLLAAVPDEIQDLGQQNSLVCGQQILLGTKQGLFRLDSGQLVRDDVLHTQLGAAAEIRQVATSRDGRVAVAANEGLFVHTAESGWQRIIRGPVTAVGLRTTCAAWDSTSCSDCGLPALRELACAARKAGSSTQELKDCRTTISPPPRSDGGLSGLAHTAARLASMVTAGVTARAALVAGRTCPQHCGGAKWRCLAGNCRRSRSAGSPSHDIGREGLLLRGGDRQVSPPHSLRLRRLRAIAQRRRQVTVDSTR